MEMKEGLLKDLKSLGCPLYFAVDMNSLTEEEQEDFRRALEKKYNRRLMTTETGDYINPYPSFFCVIRKMQGRLWKRH